MTETDHQAVILVIDDEPTILKMVARRLEEEGHRVLTALTGEEGLTLASTAHPDVVLLDILLPTLSGLAVLRGLRGDPTTQDIPVIMLTVKGTDRDILLSMGLGAFCHLAKPYQPRQLVEEVGLAVWRHRQLHGARATPDQAMTGTVVCSNREPPGV